MRHPNKIQFEGCLAVVDAPSTTAPFGARGHRILLTRRAAKAALPTLTGMGVCLGDGPRLGSGHQVEAKYGVIERAWLRGDEIRVAGYLFARDCSSVVKAIQAVADPWGMSFETVDVRVANLNAEVWRITSTTFTGAAVTRAPAYARTWFRFVEDAFSDA